MSRARAQRYTLTAEFVLRERRDYEFYRKKFEDYFKSLDSPAFQSDYLAIEKTHNAGEEPMK